MTVPTHHATVRYLAVCENQGCDFRVECMSSDEALEEVAMHRMAHELRHTCKYDEHFGWVGLPDCPACDYERPPSLRRGVKP